MVPMKGEVVMAAPGLTMPVIVMTISATSEVVAKALFTVTTKLLTLQVAPTMEAPPMLTSIHVVPEINVLVNSAGKVTVAVSLVRRGVDAQGV